ncbi:MAG TPA: DUF29 domain-containing protein [Allosphingosinicella sp.]|nr:DUF29 domain-containing protein [Allosphingosinicella sp.]
MAEREHIIQLRGTGPGYEEDYAAWVDHQVGLIKAGRWNEIDRDNLIDEVESLGLSVFKGFVSAIEVVLLHMLKWDFQPERRSRSWIASVDEHRLRAEQELEDSPSYKARIEEAVKRAYRVARLRAAGETDLPIKTFPAECPYDWAQIMEREHALDA